LLPPPLPHNDALQIAQLARVPEEEHEQFLRCLHGVVADIWMVERRALGSDPGSALVRAAETARALHKVVSKLAPIDRKWVEHLRRRTYDYNHWLRDVPKTVFQLAHLLSIAARLSPPRAPGFAAPDHQKSDRDRTTKHLTFLFLARWLKLLAHEFGGKLGDARLLKAVEILKPHLPDGVVPKNPARRLKRVPPYVSILPLDLYSPEPSA